MLNNEVLAAMSVRISADTAKFTNGLNKAVSPIGVLSRQLTKLGPAMMTAFSVGSVISFGSAVVKAAEESRMSEAKLNRALKDRFDISSRLKSQAKELQLATLYGDEETMNAQSRLASILGINEDGIKRLLPLIQDFATVKEMDLARAAELVGKSVGSSTNALKRYGIDITGAANSSERLDSAVMQLTEHFGGQATAAAEASNGTTQLKNQWDELKETLGQGNWLKKVTGHLTDMIRIINSADLSVWDKFKSTFAWGVWGTGKGTKEKLKEIEEIKKGMNLLAGMSGGIINKDGNKNIEKVGALQSIMDQISEYQELQKSASVSEIGNINLILKKLEKKREKLLQIGLIARETNKIEKIEGLGASVSSDLKPKEIQLQYSTSEALSSMSIATENEMNALYERGKSYAEAINNGIQDGLELIGESIGDALSGGDVDFGSMFLETLASMAERLGKLAIGIGFATEGIKVALKTLGGVGAIAAGIALIALAKVARNSMKSIASGSGGGGSVNSAMSQGGGGLSIFRNYGDLKAQAIEVTVDGQISGDVIRLANSRSENKHNRLT